MRLAIVLVFVAAIATHVQGYKIRIVRKHYKIRKHEPVTKNQSQHEHKYPSPVPGSHVHYHQKHWAELYKKHERNIKQSHVGERGKKYYVRHSHHQHKTHSGPHDMTVKEKINVIPAHRINKMIVKLCENTNMNILAVWKNVAKKLGIEKGYPIKNAAELKKLTILIKTFVDLSKKNYFKRMTLHHILKLIDESLKRRHRGRKTTKEERDKTYESRLQILPYYTDLGHGYSSMFDLENYYTEKPYGPLDSDEIVLNTPSPFNSIKQKQKSEALITTPFESSASDEIIRDTPVDLLDLDEMDKMISTTHAFSNSEEDFTVKPLKPNDAGEISSKTTPSYSNSDEYITVKPIRPINPDEISKEELNPLDSDENMFTTPNPLHLEEYIAAKPLKPIIPDDISTEVSLNSINSDESILTAPSSFHSKEYITVIPFKPTNSDEISTEKPFDPLDSDENMFTTPNPLHSEEYIAEKRIKPIIPYDVSSEVSLNRINSDESILATPSSFHSKEYITVIPLKPTNSDESTEEPFDPVDSNENTFTTSSYFNSGKYITAIPLKPINRDKISTEVPLNPVDSDENIYRTPSSFHSEEYITVRPLRPRNSSLPLDFDENISHFKEHGSEMYFEHPDFEKDAEQQTIDNDLNSVMLALLPDLLAHYSKCERTNEVSSRIVAGLTQVVETLKKKKCRKRDLSTDRYSLSYS